MDRVVKFFNLPIRYHIFTGFAIRLVLIAYGQYHDDNFEVRYTDVDYDVYNDAGRYVLEGDSPYKRDTYRYSPIIAYLVCLNTILGYNYGKVLFSVFDVFVALSLRTVVGEQYKGHREGPKISVYCCMLWLYNPMSIAITTRGNAESVSCLFIVASVLYLQTHLKMGMIKYAISGFFLGIAIHLRIYPIVFSFPMYLSLGDYRGINRNTTLLNGLRKLVPNLKQLILVASCVLTLVSVTLRFYSMYGYEFLFETYIYHFLRKDIRHNFSVLFYYTYLSVDQMAFDIVKVISQVCQGVLLFVISLAFGCEANSLPFALFCQTVVLVTFNSVVTSQYFIWYISLLPMVIHNLKDVTFKRGFQLLMMWLIVQGVWLYYAFLLEFRSQRTYWTIFVHGLAFFIVNIYGLCELIKGFNPRNAEMNSAIKVN